MKLFVLLSYCAELNEQNNLTSLEVFRDVKLPPT